MLLHSRIFFSFLIPAALLGGLPVQATDDDYLKMLEGEAETVQLDDSGQLKQENNPQSPITSFEWDGTVNKDGFPKSLNQEAFEAFLHKYYFGTYVFFKKLDSTDKNTVHHRYSKEDMPNIENVRKDVMTLFKR